MRKLIVVSKESCKPCSLLHNFLDSKEIPYEDVEYVQENIDKYKIWSVPTILLLENDKEIDRVVGFKVDEIEVLASRLDKVENILNNVFVKVKYFDKEMPKLQQSEKGDWVDLYVSKAYAVENEEFKIKNALKGMIYPEGYANNPWDRNNRMHYSAGDTIVVRLGVAIELPTIKKANIFPRSSLFASWGLLLTNGVGCIDNIYKGDNDEWLAVFYATRDGSIAKYDRLVQFDVKDRDFIRFNEVEEFGNENRSGYGSTGK